MNEPLHPALSRRHFLRAAAMGAVAASPLTKAANESAATAGAPLENGSSFEEPARKIPLANDCDVIVCGGGPAGIAAALAAARSGARTRLFEVHGCLGGVWTAGLLTYVFDFDKPGLAREITQRLSERHARRNENASRFVYEAEEMKVLLEEMCIAAGVQFQLHTRVSTAFRDERNRLRTIVTESKAGRQAWTAPVFIDATGDGDLGAQAGCSWDVGQAKECPCQPMTMNALAVVKDSKAIAELMSFNGTDAFQGPGGHLTCVEAFKRELKRAGIETSYGHPTIFPVRDDLVMLMLNHEYGIKPWDAAAITKATVHARAEVFRVMRALRQLGGVWEGLQIAATAEQIGVRDGRRIYGRYTMSRDDLVLGRRQDDAVARVTFGVDIHASSQEKNAEKPIDHGDLKMKPYDIPLRALIARDVDGLMMAGRCISGDFISHASYRVTGNAVAMGEAAGVVAALAAKSQRLPHEVEWNEAVQKLTQIGLRS